MKIIARIGFGFLGAYAILQGFVALNSGRLEYLSVSRKFVLYPEIQITAGFVMVLVCILPLGRVVDSLTRPYLADHHVKLKPYFKRRHEGSIADSEVKPAGLHDVHHIPADAANGYSDFPKNR